MGQIAEEIIEGACCALWGQYFFRDREEEDGGLVVPVPFEHGYPVACKECWETGCGYEKATAETI